MNFGQNDVFVEQLVKRKKGTKDYLMIALAVIVYLAIIYLCLLFFQYTAPFIIIIFALITWLLWRFITSRNIEYEYICTNGYLDIDAIVNKKKRDRKISMDAKDMEIVAEVSDRAYNSYKNNDNYKTKDFSTNTGSEDVWFFAGNYDDELCLVLFEPEERIIKDLKRHNPRVVKYNYIQG